MSALAYYIIFIVPNVWLVQTNIHHDITFTLYNHRQSTSNSIFKLLFNISGLITFRCLSLRKVIPTLYIHIKVQIISK